MQKIIVIGSGVSGLSSAANLQEAGFDEDTIIQLTHINPFNAYAR